MKTVACTILLSLAVATSAFAQRTTLSATHWLAVQPGQDASAIIRQAQTTLDLTGHAVVVMLASGAHGTIGVDGSLWVGGNALMLVGQPGTTLTGLVASNGGRVQVSGVAFAACPGACIAAVDKAWVTLGAGIEFGAAVREHMVASYGSVIYATQPYTVSGSAMSHAHAYGRSSIVILPIEVTVTQQVHFQVYVYGAAMADIGTSATWTGVPVTSGWKAWIHYQAALYAPAAPLPGTGVVLRTPESTVITVGSETMELEQ